MRPGGREGQPGSDHASQAWVRRGAGDAAPLGHWLSPDLLDVGSEYERRGGADRHADTRRVNRAFRRLERPNARRVHAPRDEAADGPESRLIEPAPHLLPPVDGDSSTPTPPGVSYTPQARADP